MTGWFLSSSNGRFMQLIIDGGPHPPTTTPSDDQNAHPDFINSFETIFFSSVHWHIRSTSSAAKMKSNTDRGVMIIGCIIKQGHLFAPDDFGVNNRSCKARTVQYYRFGRTSKGIMRRKTNKLIMVCITALTFHFPHSVWSEVETHNTFIKIFNSVCRKSIYKSHMKLRLCIAPLRRMIHALAILNDYAKQHARILISGRDCSGPSVHQRVPETERQYVLMIKIYTTQRGGK